MGRAKKVIEPIIEEEEMEEEEEEYEDDGAELAESGDDDGDSEGDTSATIRDETLQPETFQVILEALALWLKNDRSVEARTLRSKLLALVDAWDDELGTV